MTRWLETDSLSNQDISSALAIGAYTADADRLVLVQFFADQVAGNGDYVFYVTQQVAGAGSHYRLIPITTAAAASGVTAMGGQSGMIAVRSGDVLTVYLDGLAGDTTTPDTTVRWFELAALRPTDADRTLDVSAGGEAGLDWANIGSPTTTVALSGTTVKTATDVETDTADIQARLPAVLVSGRIDSSVGAAASNAITAAALAADVGTEIASAVRAELEDELSRLDADVSSRLAEVDYTPPPSVVDVAAAIMESPHGVYPEGSFGNVSEWVPTSQSNAAAVRAELATELAHLDADVSSASALTPQETRDAMKLAPTAGTPAAGSIDAHLDSIIATGAGIGTGTYTDTVTDGVDPLDNVLVQLSTDAAGTNMVYRTHTAANGTYTLHPDPGTYYVWFELAGYSFTQGAQVVVT